MDHRCILRTVIGIRGRHGCSLGLAIPEPNLDDLPARGKWRQRPAVALEGNRHKAARQDQRNLGDAANAREDVDRVVRAWRY